MWTYVVRRLLYNVPVFLGIVFFLMLASLLTMLTVGLAARRARRTDAGREAPRPAG